MNRESKCPRRWKYHETNSFFCKTFSVGYQWRENKKVEYEWMIKKGI